MELLDDELVIDLINYCSQSENLRESISLILSFVLCKPNWRDPIAKLRRKERESILVIFIAIVVEKVKVIPF